MDIEPNDTNFVDPNTDDLDAFATLLDGKAQVKEETVEPEVVTPLIEDEDEIDTSEDLPDEEDDEDKPVEKPKKVNRFQERITQLTAKAREAERALEALKAQQALAKPEPAPAAPLVHDDAPNPEAKNEDGSDKYPLGEFDPMYIRDMARNTIEREWNAKQELEAKAQAQRQEQEARDQLQSQWVEKLSTVTEQHEDFLDKTMELESAFDGLDSRYSDYLVQTIKSLDHGPEVLYYFANNLDEAHKFVKMGPMAATLALGEYNAMFKGKTRQETKVSKAPPPPQVNKGSKTRTSVTADTDDLDAFSKLLFSKKG